MPLPVFPVYNSFEVRLVSSQHIGANYWSIVKKV
jgi:hypothetical protein